MKEKRLDAITEKSDNAIIIASYTFSTLSILGIYIILFLVVLVSLVSETYKVLVKRLRLKDDNSESRLYDISDDLSYQEEENYTLSHFRERINIYNEEGFNYDIHNVEL